jgi:signal transduction histidine kinase
LRAQLDEAHAAHIDPEAMAAQQTMDQADREAMGQLEAQLGERAALVDTLETQLADKTRAITELRSHMAEVEESLQNLERQLTHKTAEITTLQSRLAEAHTEARERIAALEAMGTAAGEDEIAQARVEALEAELAEKSAATEVLERQLRNTTEAMSALEEQITSTHQAVDAAITEARSVDSHDEVIASIAQELRTPMSSIMGYTDLLLRESIGILGSLQRKFLQRVKAYTERMGALLDDLVRITALDMGRLQLEPEKIDVIYAVEEAVMNVANQYREKGLVLRMALPGTMPSLTADRDALLQVIGHLLGNAGLASPVGGEVHLTVDARRETVPTSNSGATQTPCLYLAVRDSGAGVAPDEMERVFARKYRADNPLIEGLGDTGVSMSLAKALIDAHGGRIWFDSQAGQGTIFHVVIPLDPVFEG